MFVSATAHLLSAASSSLHPLVTAGGFPQLLVASASTKGPVSLSVNAANLPGSQQLQDIANGIGGWALIASLVGLVVGAAAWALGAHTQNFQQTFVGRKAVLISGLAALLIGAAQPIINFFFNTGQAIKS